MGDTLLDSLSHVVDRTVKPFTDTFGDRPPGTPERPPNPVRSVANVAGGVMGVINMPVELMNTGFAVATDAIAQALPSFPASTIASLYLAPPHGHLHPPSFTPPATPAPVPLPSFGPILLGTCVTVLIGGMPAARAGDLGMAMTCCGFFPAFEVFTGSSKVFIGGMRAARQLDICRACQPSFAAAARGVSAAMATAGMAIAMAGAAADTVDAVQESDAAMASAMGLSASMKAAQAAADAIALAMSAAMGSDMAAPPFPGAVTMGNSNVQIGGFPMINFPNPAFALIRGIRSWRSRRRARQQSPDD